MAIKKIVTLGNPILRQVARPVSVDQIGTTNTQKLIDDLIDTMFDAKGIGIAAPQIGLGLQLAIINTKDNPIAIINPVITSFSEVTELGEEGCLSIPGVFGMVLRSITVNVQYFDQQAKQQTQQVSGLLARVFQHEIDHLNGTLFIDRTKTITRGQVNESP